MEVVKTPIGHKIIDQAISASVTDDGDDVLITFPYHGLGTGDYVYVTSDIDDYNGFWYVDVIDVNTFKIGEYDDNEHQEYLGDAEIEYYQTNQHFWNSIFLPIVYKVLTDKWPTNFVDTAQSVVSQADDNGYTEMVLSGDVRANLKRLEYVTLQSSFDENLDGVYQIVEVISDSNIVIDLPYDAANDFSSTSVVYYYNNYQVKVKVWAGLDPLHPMYLYKPFMEVAELSFTPDTNNMAMFSISDYIKQQVTVRNNLTLFSLPLNLDAFTGFYIQTAESYDQSDNYSLYTYETDYETDAFEGYAVAGKLPFKNVYSGMYSDYVYTDGSPALWLTLFPELLAVQDRYFDISFIKNIRGQFWVIIDKYVQDYLTSTEVQTFADKGIGVYRIPIVPDAQYDRFCVRVHTPGVPASAGVPVTTLAALTAWVNAPGSIWTPGAAPTTSVNGLGGVDGYFVGAIATTIGYSYEFTTELEIGVTGSLPPTASVIWALLGGAFNVIDSVTFNYTTAGIKTETFTLIDTAGGAYLGVFITNNTNFETKNFTINDAAYNAPAGPPDDSIPSADITEEICIDIIDACDSQADAGADDIRLLEDGDYRLLE